MMRQFRRSLRQWKGELGTFWRRFSTFYRLVLAILLAMIIVYGARRQILDQRRAALVALRKELADQNVPLVVPSPKGDDQVLESELQAENLWESLEHEREMTRKALDRQRIGGRTQALETIEKLSRLIVRHRLVVRTAARIDCADELPVPRVCQSYHLVGNFAGIHGFLREVTDIGTPCQLRRVAVTLDEGSAPGSQAAQAPLALTFDFVSLYAE